MNIKTLSFAILSSILLSACGGGSDNSNQSNSTPNDATNNNSKLTQWSTFRLDYTEDESYDLEILNTQFNIVGGKLYIESYDAPEEFYLTQTGEYVSWGPINSRYGSEVGDITVNDNQFIIRPYSKIGSKGLVFTMNNKKFDISGQAVLAAVDHDINWSVKYPQFLFTPIPAKLLTQLKSHQTLTFPSGSICLQETQYTNNQTYLNLYDADNENKQSFEKYAADYLNNTDPNYLKLIQYPNATAYININGSSGLAEYQGKYFNTHLEQDGIEFDLSEMIQKRKKFAEQANISAEEKSALIEYAEDLNKRCDLYNDVAIKFLKQNIKF